MGANKPGANLMGANRRFEMRTHIAAAKAIREELKANYPNTAFSVRAGSQC